jgi:hypothetical protein
MLLRDWSRADAAQLPAKGEAVNKMLGTTLNARQRAAQKPGA